MYMTVYNKITVHGIFSKIHFSDNSKMMWFSTELQKRSIFASSHKIHKIILFDIIYTCKSVIFMYFNKCICLYLNPISINLPNVNTFFSVIKKNIYFVNIRSTFFRFNQ